MMSDYVLLWLGLITREAWFIQKVNHKLLANGGKSPQPISSLFVTLLGSRPSNLLYLERIIGVGEWITFHQGKLTKLFGARQKGKWKMQMTPIRS